MMTSDRSERSILLPNLSLLALLDLVYLTLPRWPIFLGLGSLVALFYLAYIVLVTRDISANAEELNPFDRLLCRWSGPIAIATCVGLVLAVMQSDFEREPTETWIGSSWGMMTIKYTMEIGFISSVACWCVPRTAGDISSIVWRILVVPLLVVYGTYLVLLPVGQLVGDCDKKEPYNVSAIEANTTTIRFS